MAGAGGIQGGSNGNRSPVVQTHVNPPQETGQPAQTTFEVEQAAAKANAYTAGPGGLGGKRGTTGRTQSTAPEAGLLQKRRTVNRGDGPLPPGARVLQPKEGESLEAVLLRSGMYGDEISPALLAQVARMNGITDPRKPGRKPITAFRPKDIYREVQPQDKRDMLERARFIAVGPHQSWDDLVDRLITGIPNDEARRGVINALKLVNGLRDDAPPPLILVAPDWQDMVGAVVTLQQQGGSRDVRAHADGTPPPPTLRAASKDDLQSAMNVLFINGFLQEQAASHESCGPIPNAGCVIAFPNTLRKLNKARQRVSIERSSDESYVHWLDRTGTSLSPGRQWRRKRVGERVAKDVVRLQELGLVDGKGYLTFDIQDPERIEFEVGAAVDAAVRRAGVPTDSKVQEHLIAGLKNQLAGLTEGPITQVDAYKAMLIAAIGVPRDPTKPVSLIYSDTDERLLQQALLAEQFEYDPDAVTEAYSALDNPADVPIVASKIRAAVAKLDLTIEEEYRDGLQKALMRHALAIAYLERETRDYDERIKLAAQFIEMELAAGRPVGGPLPPGLAASLDFGS
jgi:hypothetical protein